MIRRLPLGLPSLAYLALLVYAWVYQGQLLFLVWLLLVLARLWWLGRQRFLAELGVCLCLMVVFWGQGWRSNQAYQRSADQVDQVLVRPDSIRVKGDQLSFRGQASGQTSGQTYQVFYRLKTQQEQAFFDQLDSLVVLEGQISLSEAQTAGNFRGFDYRAYLKSQGIYRIGQLEGLEAVREVPASNLLDILSIWRRRAILHIQDHFPAPMQHYMTGLLFAYLDEDFEAMSDLYSQLGIIHLFALSGAQVGFFLGWFRQILLRLGLTQGQVDACQLPFSLIYAGLTGWQMSVIRSLLQAMLARCGLKGLDNLACCALVVLLLAPQAMTSPGTVLTFSYALVLIFLDGAGEGWWAAVWQSLALSLAVLPVLLWYFASFQPVSILLTALLGLLFDSILLPLVSLAFIASPFLSLAGANQAFVLLEQLLIVLGKWLSRPLILGSPSLLVLVLLLVALGFWQDYRKHRKISLALGLLVISLFFLTKHPLENEVTLVNVGQGDSIFLRDIAGKTLLIDVGGRLEFGSQEDWRAYKRPSNASRTLIPYLKSRGVGRIDQLVLTHTDTDHIGDLEEVAQVFSIGEILVSQGSLTDEDFVARLQDLGIGVRVIGAGDSLPIMGSQLQVLYPWETGDGGNNDSLVLYGLLLGKNFLFTGDLEAGELELIKRYPDLPVDVLKAGHHGSKGSSYPEFLAHIGADVALVSAGVNNRYQHPHQETLDRFDQAGMAVYRTDEQGAIRFRGWKQWQIETAK